MKDPTKTTLADGRTVGKDSDIAWLIGTVDEVNAFIGLAKVFAKNKDIKEVLGNVQRLMFKIGSDFALGPKITEEDYEWLLLMIDRFEREVNKPRNFVILEKDESTAFLSVARAVVRRAERWAVKLRREGIASELAVECLNKLSYLLYLLILKEGGEFEKI
jgi:cob(I)alamin adenosyltransferase